MSEPFTADEVKRVAQELWDDTGFAEWRAQNRVRYDWLHRLAPINIPGISLKLENRGSELEQDRFLWNSVLAGPDAIIEVTPRGDDKPAREAASRVEDFFYSIFHDWKRRRTSRLYAPYGRAIDQMTCYGGGMLGVDWDQTIRQDILGQRIGSEQELTAALRKNEAAFRRNPFVIHCPDLSALAWEPDFSRVAEVGERTYAGMDEKLDWQGVTSDTTEEGGRESQSQSGRRIKVYHLETRDYVYDLVINLSSGAEETPFEYRPNLAGRPMYAFSPARLTSERSPAYAFLPLMGPLYPVAYRLAILRTLIDSGALQTGRNMWQLVKVGRPTDSYLDLATRPAEEQGMIRVDVTEEMLPQPAPGYEWKAVPVPDQAQLIRAFQVAREDRLAVGFPGLLLPEAPVDATSGYDRARMQEAANRFIKPPLDSWADAWKELFLLVADVIKNADVSVRVPLLRRAEGRGREDGQHIVTIQPQDFQEFDLLVRFRSVSEAAVFAAKTADENSFKAGLLSEQTLFEKWYDAPLTEQERIAADRDRRVVDEFVEQDIRALIAARRQAVMAEVAQEFGLPLPPPGAGGPQTNGVTTPAMAEGLRRARPPGGSLPGVGVPPFPPEQPETAGGPPPSLGTSAQGQST